MALVYFHRDFDFRPPSDFYHLIAYKAGMLIDVDDECAEAAVEGGYADYAEDDPRIVDDGLDEIGVEIADADDEVGD